MSLRVKHTQPRPPIKVTVDGKGLVSHSGTRLLADMAERSGLQDDLWVALSPLVRRPRRHDPGRVLVDLAVMAADGGGYSSDLAPLREKPAQFGPVASQPTAWRLLDAIDADITARVATARAAARARMWAAGLAPKSFTLDFDATLIDVHTDYVPRQIIGVLFPTVLCARPAEGSWPVGVNGSPVPVEGT